jgi:chemotaxis methyl-accepting protein methylase
MSSALKLPYWQVAWLRDTVAARCGLYLGGPHEAYLSGQAATRMLEMQINFADYSRILQESPVGSGELQILIERLCIHETSFMRDPSHFQALARFIIPQLVREARRVGRQRLRMVSAGCSTGEEAYSLAMIAQEAAPVLEDITVEVVGLDVSSDAVDRATRGVYPARALATLEPWRRQRYFRSTGTEYEVAPELRSMIRWLRWNLTGGLPVMQVDVIFCRNVLIYFQGIQRRTLAGNLVAALHPRGFLVVGYTDSLQAYRDILEPIRINSAVVFRRAGRPVVTAAYTGLLEGAPLTTSTIRSLD